MIEENMPIGTFVAHVKVYDRDSKQNAVVTCHLDSQKLLLHQRYVSEYYLLTSTILDREEENEFELSMTCQDGGSPSWTSSILFTIKVVLNSRYFL